MAATRVIFYDETLREMARWAAKRYRIKSLAVVFRDGYRGAGYVGGSGTADFQRGHGYIELNERRTHSQLVQVLAHELAHVVTMKRFGYGGHGPKFARNLKGLISAWNSHANRERGARW